MRRTYSTRARCSQNLRKSPNQITTVSRMSRASSEVRPIISRPFCELFAYVLRRSHDIRTYVVRTSHKLRKNGYCRETFGEKLLRILEFAFLDIRILRKSFACPVKTALKIKRNRGHRFSNGVENTLFNLTFQFDIKSFTHTDTNGIYTHTHAHTHTHTHTHHWRKSPGGWGDVSPPPTFFGWGVGCTNIPPPPLFEDKITSNLTFIVKKLTFLTVKLFKNSKKWLARSARSHTNVF